MTFLHGAQSRSLVAAAVGAGFHYVDGDAVAPTLAKPERIVPFQLADLYRPHEEPASAGAPREGIARELGRERQELAHASVGHRRRGGAANDRAAP